MKKLLFFLLLSVWFFSCFFIISCQFTNEKILKHSEPNISTEFHAKKFEVDGVTYYWVWLDSDWSKKQVICPDTDKAIQDFSKKYIR